MALAKKYRLNRGKDIKNVFSKGKTIKGGLFFIKVFPNSFGHARVTVIVSKKISNKATQRNLVKRRLSSAIKKEYLLRNGYDVAIIALPPILGKPSKEIKTEMDKATKNFFVYPAHN